MWSNLAYPVLECGKCHVRQDRRQLPQCSTSGKVLAPHLPAPLKWLSDFCGMTRSLLEMKDNLAENFLHLIDGIVRTAWLLFEAFLLNLYRIE